MATKRPKKTTTTSKTVSPKKPVAKKSTKSTTPKSTTKAPPKKKVGTTKKKTAVTAKKKVTPAKKAVATKKKAVTAKKKPVARKKVVRKQTTDQPAKIRLKRRMYEYEKLAENAHPSKFHEMGQRVQRKEMRWAYFTTEDDIGYHYYVKLK